MTEPSRELMQRALDDLERQIGHPLDPDTVALAWRLFDEDVQEWRREHGGTTSGDVAW